MKMTKSISGRTWHFSHAIGRLALAGEGFYHPTSVIITDDDSLYVLNHRPTGSAPLAKWTVEQEYISEFGAGDFVWPEGLAIDDSQNVYCSDAYSNFVASYDSNGELIRKWGETGSSEGKLHGPSGLAFDKEGNLLVCDSLNNRIQKFSEYGEYISSFGTEGANEGQFNRPWGISVDDNNDIYVADWGNNRVQKFSESGDFILTFGSEIDDGGKLNHPSDVAIDADGDVYVADWGNNRIQIYYSDGDIMTSLLGDAQEFSNAATEFLAVNPEHVKAFRRVDPVEYVELGRFQRPAGISINSSNRIVVSDGIRCRLQIYLKDDSYLEPQFNL